MAQMKYYYELTVSSSPHVHQDCTTKTIMRDVLIALVPALLFAVYNFGPRALTVTLVSVLSCYVFETQFCSLMPFSRVSWYSEPKISTVLSTSSVASSKLYSFSHSAIRGV